MTQHTGVDLWPRGIDAEPKQFDKTIADAENDLFFAFFGLRKSTLDLFWWSFVLNALLWTYSCKSSWPSSGSVLFGGLRWSTLPQLHLQTLVVSITLKQGLKFSAALVLQQFFLAVPGASLPGSPGPDGSVEDVNSLNFTSCYHRGLPVSLLSKLLQHLTGFALICCNYCSLCQWFILLQSEQ